MDMLNTNLLYSLILLLAGSVSSWISWLAWRNRKRVQGSVWVALFSAAIAFWSLTYAIHWTSFPKPSPFFWVDMTYIGVVTFPSVFLIFALIHSGRTNWVRSKNFFWMPIQPLLTLIFLWTDPYLGWFFAGKRQSADASIYDGSAWFWFHVVYSYTFILISLFLLAQYYFRCAKIYRRQTGMILLGISIPLMTNIISILGYDLVNNLDVTPMAFTITSVCIAIGIFRFRLLELRPIAHDILFKNIQDGVVVVDANQQIVDINPPAKYFLSRFFSDPIGKTLNEIIQAFPEIPENILAKDKGQGEIQVTVPEIRFFEWQVSHLVDQNQRHWGNLVTFRDITTRKQVELALTQVNARLAQKLDEIKSLQAQLLDQAIRDPLTGLYNRRYLSQVLQRELPRADRDQRPIAIILLDLDHFKQINDRFGHAVGDDVLKLTGEVFLQNIRKGDVACRYGGEEFLLIFPGVATKVGHRRLLDLLSILQDAICQIQTPEILLTASCGIAEYPKDGLTPDELLQVADHRMYCAKQKGRNQICFQG